jgi:anaerobic selenocysteine-containing dehydrogenase
LRFTTSNRKDNHENDWRGGVNDMTSLTALLSKWPLIRQIRERTYGTGLEVLSDKTRAMHARIDDAHVARSICPYCGVGCGQLIYHKDGRLISIEGDPESPISQGNLCPKGAASYQLLTHDRRETKMKYRAPRDRDSRVVFTSHTTADPFWNRGLGICSGSSGIAWVPNRCAQFPGVLRGRG